MLNQETKKQTIDYGKRAKAAQKVLAKIKEANEIIASTPGLLVSGLVDQHIFDNAPIQVSVKLDVQAVS